MTSTGETSFAGIEDRRSSGTGAPPPSVLSWNLTRRCPLRCPHCSIDSVARDRPSEGETGEAECLAVVDQVAAWAGGSLLILSGGEPLLRDDLGRIARRARDAGLFPVVGTSGIGLDAGRVADLASAGVTGLSVSLDSVHPEQHDRFRGLRGAHGAAVAGVRAAAGAGLPVVVQHSLMEFNARNLGSMAEFAADLGAAVLNVFFLVCTGRGERVTRLSADIYERSLREVASLRDLWAGRIAISARCAPHFARIAGERGGLPGTRQRGCPAGIDYLRIGPEGMVTPCPYLQDPLGDVRSSRLQDLWNGPALSALREPVLNGRCGRCEHARTCGGCRARALAETGDLFGDDPICTWQPGGGAIGAAPAEEAPGPLRWTEEASAAVGRIPAFVRKRAIEAIERRCRAAGAAEVTLDRVLESRPGGVPFRHPR